MSSINPNKYIFALVDCDTFYASCERVFQPKIKNDPIIVLSNNDGCAVALSRETKKLGIPFGQPYFKLKPLIEKHNIKVFSSNYELYGDLSRRVMQTLSTFSPDIEYYSIDEAFLRLDLLNISDLHAYGLKIKKTVEDWVGVPVTVGIGSTKTLAKVATDIGKEKPEYEGVFILEEKNRVHELSKIPVQDIWGIGSQKRKLLNSYQINTALDLINAEDKFIQKQLSIVGLRTVWELRGISCLPIEEMIPPKKGICSSRSFGHDVTSLEDLEEAVATYAARACVKLRKQNSVCGCIHVWITTNSFKDVPQYSNTLGYRLPMASNSTPDLIHAAHQALKKIYREGYQYKKAGIFLSEITPATGVQSHLFYDPKHYSKEKKLMEVVDRINKSYGSSSLFFGAMGITQDWKMIRNQKSPSYTTRWNELLTVKAN
jgi:DNA polymerase V